MNVIGGDVFWVYAFSDGTVTKIGRTSDLPKRFDTVQAEYPNPLRMTFLEVLTRADSVLVEWMAHARFDYLRLHGEWFWSGPSDARKNIKYCIRSLEKMRAEGRSDDDIRRHVRKWFRSHPTNLFRGRAVRSELLISSKSNG